MSLVRWLRKRCGSLGLVSMVAASAAAPFTKVRRAKLSSIVIELVSAHFEFSNFIRYYGCKS